VKTLQTTEDVSIEKESEQLSILTLSHEHIDILNIFITGKSTQLIFWKSNIVCQK